MYADTQSLNLPPWESWVLRYLSDLPSTVTSTSWILSMPDTESQSRPTPQPSKCLGKAEPVQHISALHVQPFLITIAFQAFLKLQATEPYGSCSC
jgi:hypothetical protein